MSSILAIIPARGGSKGLKKKNIKNLNNKPLISYTINAAKNSKYIDRVIVSTEDNEIAEVAIKEGGEVPFLRPGEYATDKSPTIDSVIYTINKLNEEGYYPDYIALLQCTSPLRNTNHIDEAISKLLFEKSDAIVSVCEAEVNPYWTNVIENGKLKYFIEKGKNITRRQDLPKVYRLNGAIYIIKTEILLSERTFQPENCSAYIMDSKCSVDIDNLIDFKVAEMILSEGEE